MSIISLTILVHVKRKMSFLAAMNCVSVRLFFKQRIPTSHKVAMQFNWIHDTI